MQREYSIFKGRIHFCFFVYNCEVLIILIFVYLNMLSCEKGSKGKVFTLHLKTEILRELY